MTDLVKIFFHLQQVEAGYPEVSAESVWAKPTGAADEYIVDNIPFFTRDATIGDTLKALKKEGALWFDSLRQRSGNSLIRVVFFEKSLKEKIDDKLNTMGCSTEYSKDHAEKLKDRKILRQKKTWKKTRSRRSARRILSGAGTCPAWKLDVESSTFAFSLVLLLYLPF